MKKENNIRGETGDDKSKLFDLIGLTGIAGISVTKAAELHVMLGINNIQELYEACRRGEISRLKGWGTNMEEKIKTDIELNVLWLMSKCAQIRKAGSSNYQASKLDKDFLLALARSQAEKNNNK
jgi:DNA polymerase/3'-5' exonuclease PolX